MALFKIFKGEFASTLNERRPNANEGYCYFATNEGKMFIDIGDGDVKENPELRVCLNAAHADEADRLTWHNIGDEHKPIYLNGSGEPVECDDILAVGISGGLHDVNGALRNVGTAEKPIYFEDGLPVKCNDTLAVNISGVAEVAIGATQLIDPTTSSPWELGGSATPIYFKGGYPVTCIDSFLPLSAGEQYKIKGPLGLTAGENYGTIFDLEDLNSKFEGQIFFAEDPNNYLYLPSGGISGQVLMKNSSTDGDARWTTLSNSYLPLSGGILTGSLSSTCYITSNYGYADPNEAGATTIDGKPIQGIGVNGALYFKIIS